MAAKQHGRDLCGAAWVINNQTTSAVGNDGRGGVQRDGRFFRLNQMGASNRHVSTQKQAPAGALI